ncbi:hypothetical protein EVAR_28726_1 [Eumeta japonica]|uniref:Uncharacterized protein n=1 Tax=Eumeta variegata TaxID=151549 RepID=A0A4C1V4Y8_EUMVA|nr:hypothetical protein EVAR_28726_1 [Eumeta japonica]
MRSNSFLGDHDITAAVRVCDSVFVAPAGRWCDVTMFTPPLGASRHLNAESDYGTRHNRRKRIEMQRVTAGSETIEETELKCRGRPRDLKQ